MSRDVVAIHIEDEKDWQIEIKDSVYMDKPPQLKDFVTVNSIKQAERILQSISDSIVLIVDLMEDKDELNFSGYHWLLEDLNDFLANKANTSVFVVSGQLNNATIASLSRNNIPESHIFGKADWHKNRERFSSAISDVINHMPENTWQNIVQRRSATHIDPYLIDSYSNEGDITPFEVNDSNLHNDDDLRPMLIRTRDSSWSPQQVPGLIILGRIENIVSALGSAETLMALESDSEVLSIEASRPSKGYECDRSLSYVRAHTIQNHFAEKGDKVIIGFVDSGIDILHKAFRDSSGNKTRIFSIWDQRDSTGPPPNGHPHGTLYTEERLNEFITSGKVPERLKVGPYDHGTHVASIAAGQAIGDFAGGMAPQARIVMVIPASEKTSIGYSTSYLTGIEYIASLSEEMKLPVVINISAGMNSGAHDGTSSLERGFDLVTGNGSKAGIIIVKSAGNTRKSNLHAKLKLISNTQEVLRWSVSNGNSSPDNLELWFASSDHLSFRLKDPSGNKTEWVDSLSRPIAEGSFSQGNTYRLIYTKSHVDNGQSQLFITIKPGRLPRIKNGSWELEVRSGIVRSDGEVDAWLERQSGGTVFLNHISQEHTVSIPGTSHYAVTVGSIKNGSARFHHPSDFSSLGPTWGKERRHKPDIVAPGEDIVAAKSNSGVGTVVMNGTSMAAPHAAGAIGLLFSYREKQKMENPSLDQFNAHQILASITQTTRDFRSIWNPGMGYGVLDTEAFFKDLLGQMRSQDY